MKQRLSLTHCKRVIAITWLTGAGLLFVLLAVQSLGGHYGASQAQVWAWYLGAVSPTLGLIVAVLGAEALTNQSVVKQVDAFFYRIVVWVSVIYLAALWAIVLIAPVRTDLKDGLPELIAQAGQWLTVLQGLVTGSLGIFFVRPDSISKDGVKP